MLEEVDVVYGDGAEPVDALLLFSPLGWVQESTFEGLNRNPIVQAHIRRDVVEEARSPGRRLCIYMYAVAAENEFVQRDGQRVSRKRGR
jgi:hypothetical protein